MTTYNSDEIARLLNDLEARHSKLFRQDVGSVAKKAMETASKDISVVSRMLKKAATTDLRDFVKKVEMKYYIEVVKAAEAGEGDLWDFYVYAGDKSGGSYYRLGKTNIRIIVEHMEPESLRLRKRKKKLEEAAGRGGSNIAETKEIADALSAIKAREVSRPDFERLFKARESLMEFGHEDFVKLKNYLSGFQRIPNAEKPWINLAEPQAMEEQYYTMEIHEFNGKGLDPARKYRLSYIREKTDYSVVYSDARNRSVPLFRIYKDGKRCAINDTVIPPGINRILTGPSS